MFEKLDRLKNDFSLLYKKYIVDKVYDLNFNIILNNIKNANYINVDIELFNMILEDHKFVINKTKNNLFKLKIIIDMIEKIPDNDIYTECINIFDNICELDESINKHNMYYRRFLV